MPSMLSLGPSSAAPLSAGSGGRTASVLEFVCLFTHDLRRKQKRWEDGRLKYHTFNKRVMVYDERGHFIGDLHWQHDWDFGEGEEVQLERGGVIVQVVECVGRQEQDLTELLDKRAKEKEQRQARVSVRPSLPAAPNTPMAGARANEHFQTRHRPLNQLLGTPTGHHGRAVVPTESPFELRQKVNADPSDRTDPRPLKRRKCDITPPTKLGYAQQLFGATLSLSAVPVSSAPPRRPPGSTYRAPADRSSPPEIAAPDVRPSDIGKRLAGEMGSRASSSMASVVPGSSRTSAPPDQRASSDDEESVDAAPSTLGSLQPQRVVAALPMTVQRSAETNLHRPLSSRLAPPLTAAARRTKQYIRPGTVAETDEQEFEAAPFRSRVEDNRNNGVTVAPELGASRSQAILLDEDQGSNPGAQSQLAGRQGVRDATGSNGRVARTTKQRPSKRIKLPEVAVQPPSVESRDIENVDEPAQEQRTELRLKPRQKRGLLLLSEKKKKTKQPKRRDTTAKQPNPSGQPPEQLTSAAAAKVNVALEAQSVDLWSMDQHHEPFPSSPPVPRKSAPGPASRPEHVAPLETEDANPLSPEVGTNPSDLGDGREDVSVTPESPKSPRSTYDNPSGAEDGSLDLSPSPQGRRVTPRRKVSAKVYTDPSRTSSPDLEEPSTGATQEPTLPESSRQTRKTKNVEDRRSSRSKKKARIVDSESDGEDLPQAPVRPRLARLSRKSVRSREVIGFVPSSPPVVNPANLQPRLGVRGPDLLVNDAAATSHLVPPRGATSPEPSAIRGAARQHPVSLAQTASSRPDRTLQRPTPLSSDGNSEIEEENPRLDQAATLTSPSSDGPPRNRSVDSQTSAASPPESDKDKNAAANAAAAASVRDVESIAAPERETAASTTRAGTANQEAALAVESTTMRSPLHSDSFNLPEPPGDPISDAPAKVSDSGVTGGANNHLPAAPAAGPSRPRIANPATRGRKAALKSDAAGQVPLSILPVDPIPARVVMRAPAMPRADPAVSERPKRKMKFPGFASAKGGGPWSREAHDLLESARPC